MSSTIRIRIAVMVDAAGNWQAAGWGGESVFEPIQTPEGMCEESMPHLHPQATRYVVVDLPLPEEAVEVEGRIEDA